MKHKLLFVIFILAGSAFIIWSMLYQAGSLNQAGKITAGERELPPPPAMQFVELKAKTIPVIYTAVGTVQSRETIDVISRLAAARILEIKVRSGDYVKQGELLIKLDDRDLVAAVNSAQENLKAAQSRRDFAESDFKRNEQLIANNAIARRTFEESLTTLNASRAEVAMLKHVLENAEVNLSYAQITAPFDGVVAERFNDPGDLATPQKAILTFFDPTKLQIKVPVRESLISSIKVNEIMDITIEALHRDLKAQIKEIIPSVDVNSRTFTVNGCLLGDTAQVMPGMFAVAHIVTGKEDALLIPASSITRVGQLEYLNIKHNDKVIRQPVRTAPYSPELLKIISGVRQGDYYESR